MLTLDEIKGRLRKRIIDLEGHVEPADLDDIVEDAKELGMTDEQIARLVPEIDQTINWEHIRVEKEKAIEAAAIEAERQAKRQEEIDSAPEYLDALISYCMADGIVEPTELRIVFDKAKNLDQSLHVLAVKVKGLLDKGRFRPFPAADLNADGLHEVLMSTTWYTAKLHPQLQQPPVINVPPPPPSPPPQPMRIELFRVERGRIKKGEATKLSWKVSGTGRITISNLGATETLVGQQTIKPDVTTTYVLNTGTQTSTLTVEVIVSGRSEQLAKVALAVILIVILLRVGC